MTARRSKVIDFTKALELRNARLQEEREEPVEFLPFSFAPESVTANAMVEVVIDKTHGVGIAMTREDAEKLARALRAAARSGKKKPAE